MSGPVRRAAKALLRKQLDWQMAWKPLNVFGARLPEACEFDVLDVVSDLLGVPESTDRLRDRWSQVLEGRMTIEEFIVEADVVGSGDTTGCAEPSSGLGRSELAGEPRE